MIIFKQVISITFLNFNRLCLTAIFQIPKSMHQLEISRTRSHCTTFNHAIIHQDGFETKYTLRNSIESAKQNQLVDFFCLAAESRFCKGIIYIIL